MLAAFDSTLTWLPFQLYLNTSEIQAIQKVFDSVSVQNGTSQGLQHSIQRRWIQQGVVPQIQVVLHNGGQIQPINPNSSYFTAFCGTLVCWYSHIAQRRLLTQLMLAPLGTWHSRMSQKSISVSRSLTHGCTSILTLRIPCRIRLLMSITSTTSSVGFIISVFRTLVDFV